MNMFIHAMQLQIYCGMSVCHAGRLRHSAFPTMVFGKTQLKDNTTLGNLGRHA